VVHGLFRLFQVAAELLTELNPDVQGQHHVGSPESLLSAPDALTPYSLVVATQCTGGSVGDLD